MNDLDWEHVIEEIEDVGGSQLGAVKSHLGLAMLHALKALAWPDHPAVKHWQDEITVFLVNWGLGGVVPGLSLTSEVRYFGTLSPNPEPGSHPPARRRPACPAR